MHTYTDIDKILVPVPLNGELSDALTQALRFQEVYGSEIVLLNVVSKYSVFHRLLNPEKLKKHHKKAKRKLKKRVKKYFNGTIPENIRLKVEDGTLISSILKTARQENCDLIIIKKARRLRSRFTFLRAENADRMIAESHCPVITIPHKPTPEKIRTIMVPVEILKPSDNKVAWAISVAKQFNAKLHLVSVLSADIMVKNSLSYKHSRRIEKMIRSHGVEVEKEILKSRGKDPVRVILDHADSIRPELLVILTRKESMIRDNDLGSFAREIIHNAHVPVMNVVPASDQLPYTLAGPISHNTRNSNKQYNKIS
jgi:nucleotide-binding universal stress UspA family protein